jgi:hypothetical protein
MLSARDDMVIGSGPDRTCRRSPEPDMPQASTSMRPRISMCNAWQNHWQ